MTDIADTADSLDAKSPSKPKDYPQDYPQDDPKNYPNSRPKPPLWHTLGHYALGELSVGHTRNALYAYRLLVALEPSETRWQLGRAFCALNLRALDEAQETLESVSDAPFASLQENLLHQCRERLAYLQQQSTPRLTDQPQGKIDKKQPKKQPKNQDRNPNNKGKVLSFPNATH